MCGVIGRWSLESAPWPELTRSIEHLKPRGPDSQSTLRFKSGDRLKRAT
jgi:hypothetical protein